MSSPYSVHQRPSVSMLRELLQNEKVNTRVWLRAEIDRLLDPMIDSIFKRLETKLINGLERSQSGDGSYCAQVGNFTDQSATFIAQPSTSSFTSSLNPTSSHHLTHQHQFAQTFSPPFANEQSNRNVVINSDNEEEEYDKYVYGGIKRIENEDGDSDTFESIEEDDGQELSRPLKKAKLINPTQPVSNQQYSRQPQQQQPNNQNKSYIILSLQCPQLDCLKVLFGIDELNHHMMEQHSMGPSRCPVRDCGHSSDNSHTLSVHIKLAHKDTSQWECGKCAKHFTTYQLLSNHNFAYHLIGQFQCAFPSCTFIGEYKMKIYNHYFKKHKTLSGVRPYLCNLPQCDYASSRQSDTLRHIRAHLARYEGTDSVDPKDYLEVVHELL